MTRDEAIAIIERTYPADSEHTITSITGQRLLIQARTEVLDWRDQPEAVLVRYAELCREEQQRRERALTRNRAYYGYGGTYASHAAEGAERG